MKPRKKTIFFDLDGTLYTLRGGSYKRSPLRRKVTENAQKYIARKLSKKKIEAHHILNYIKKKYGNEISIGLEKEFGIDRFDYFNTVWNIAAYNVVKKTKGLRQTLLSLKKEYDLIIVSDAPQIWIANVLNYLDIQDIFYHKIFSGEGNRRKGFSNAFLEIAQALKINPSQCIVVGDQEDTDIIPAKKIGMHTVFIHPKKHSYDADTSISLIHQLPEAVGKISQNIRQ